MHLSIQPFIQLSYYSSSHLSIHPCISLSIYFSLFIHACSHPSKYPYSASHHLSSISPHLSLHPPSHPHTSPSIYPPVCVYDLHARVNIHGSFLFIQFQKLLGGFYLSISVQQVFHSGAEEIHILLQHFGTFLWQTRVTSFPLLWVGQCYQTTQP